MTLLTDLLNSAKDTVRGLLFTTVERLAHRVGYPFHQDHYGRSIVRTLYFKELYDQIGPLDGDIVECGVAYGQSLMAWSALAQQEGKGRTVRGFDSFQGFPTPTREDVSARRAREGAFREASAERILAMAKMAGLPPPVLTGGFFENTLPSFDGAIALLHVDCDLYESYRTVLGTLFDRVVPGGIVAFDDYGSPLWPGATKAVDEFVAGRYPLRKADHLNRYYLVKA